MQAYYWQDKKAVKAIGYAISSVGSMTALGGLIWAGRFWGPALGPIGAALSVAGSLIVVGHDIYESTLLGKFSEAIHGGLKNGSYDTPSWYPMYADKSLDADFEAATAIMGTMRKGAWNEDNLALLRERGVPNSMWHLLLNGYPAPLGAGKLDKKTPPRDRGPGYSKQKGEWNY